MSLFSIVIKFLVIFMTCIIPGTALRPLQVGFYSKTCPNAESIVRSFVQAATRKNPATPAQLLRLHYHDCFVQGCDGSILIQKTIEGEPERRSSNHAGLDGFRVIDDTKAQLESECQGVVSCADIVALAARDAVALRNGPIYRVPTGRRDGRVSNINDADDMPLVSDPVEVLKAKFADKGLSENDLVLLTGAHTIGTTDCFFVRDRLYNFLPGGGHDPLINPNFLPELKSICHNDNSPGIRLPLDHGSEGKFDTKIMENIKTGFGVIASDAILYTNPSMKEVIDSYVGPTHSRSRHNFGLDFVESIVRMGQVGVLAGKDGEIRRVCSEFN